MPSAFARARAQWLSRRFITSSGRWTPRSTRPHSVAAQRRWTITSGLGGILLADALLKVAHASRVLAMAGMIVDAKDEDAASFYRHFGFIALPGQPGRLLLSAKAFPVATE